MIKRLKKVSDSGRVGKGAEERNKERVSWERGK